jgi:3-oxoacyl-[acyl-carrier protein] reductase
MTSNESKLGDNLPLSGKRAVVTGSSSGIGRAIAWQLAEAGAHVVVHGNRRFAAAEELAEIIRQLGREGRALQADLSQPADRNRFVESAWLAGPIDIWVNNAGADVLTGAAAEWSFAEKLEALWQLDVHGTIHLARMVGARMKAQGSGAIVNMGWDQVEHGMEGESGELFAATKGAVMAFTRSLAKSLAPEVRVNGVAPGWIRTAWGLQASKDWQTRACNESLLKRWGTPEDVARAVLFLVSPGADFIAGHMLPVNGGRA